MTTLGEHRTYTTADITLTGTAGRSGINRAVLLAWLTAGTLDILAAIVSSILKGGSALGVLRAVASGLIGARAKGAGWDVGLLGLALHFAIMLGIVVVYAVASRRLPLLLQRPLLCGTLYGVGVYAVMNAVVLPLSAIFFTPSYPLQALLTGLAIHVACVGLPIALILSRAGAAAGTPTDNNPN